MIDFLAKLPSTNTRIAVGLLLAASYVFWIMAASAVEGVWTWNVLPDAGIVSALGIFILTLTGIDAAQFIAKRITEHAELPTEPVHETEIETTTTERSKKVV